ncbi:MAG: glycerophosphodiester phosphodiesterase family protein [Rickettsiales bacterium]|nr:glycerophosphodiester phosphodiesterase family protein [Rickettsiales bacterium]
MTQGTWRIGHRGACGHAPENTLLSIRKALELGVHGIEFDIQLSKDGVPVVIHDDTLERTTSGKGLVSDYTATELQTFDAGKGELIPTLQQVLDLVDKRCRLLIELKAPNSVKPVVRVIEQAIAQLGWTYEQLYICSFDHRQIAEVKTLNMDIRTCALLVGIPLALAELASDAAAWALNPNVHHIDQALVDDAHKRGLKVIVWTANTPGDIQTMQALGVDGIISDYPDRIA